MQPEVLRSPNMNLAAAFGWLLAMNLAPRLDQDLRLEFLMSQLLLPHSSAKVRHVAQGGLIWFGMPCSSWIFMTLSSDTVAYRRHTTIVNGFGGLQVVVGYVGGFLGFGGWGSFNGWRELRAQACPSTD